MVKVMGFKILPFEENLLFFRDFLILVAPCDLKGKKRFLGKIGEYLDLQPIQLGILIMLIEFNKFLGKFVIKMVLGIRLSAERPKVDTTRPSRVPWSLGIRANNIYIVKTGSLQKNMF